jgi:hypothetical protein
MDSGVRRNDDPGGAPAPSNWLTSVKWLGGSAREGFSVSLDSVKNPSCSVGFLKFGRSKELSGMVFCDKKCQDAGRMCHQVWKVLQSSFTVGLRGDLRWRRHPCPPQGGNRRHRPVIPGEPAPLPPLKGGIKLSHRPAVAPPWIGSLNPAKELCAEDPKLAAIFSIRTASKGTASSRDRNRHPYTLSRQDAAPTKKCG